MSSIPSPVPQQPRHRRWSTFSLRMLLIFMLAVGTLLGLVMRQWNRAQRQHHAVQSLAARGYDVRYDWQGASLTWKRNPLIVNGARSSFPDVLRKWLGDDFFHDVVSVNWGQWSDRGYQRDPGAPDLWQALQDLPRLTHLEIVNETIPERVQLDPTARSNLRVLYLSDCRFESTQVAELTDGLATLEQLYLLNTKADAPIVERFLANRRLTTLELYQPPPSAIRGLRKGGNLTSLKVRRQYQAISADQIQAIGCCVGLQELELEGVLGPIASDDTLDPLTALHELRFLRLHLYGMTDRQFLVLRNLSNLQSLDLESRLIDGTCLPDFLAANRLRSLTFRHSQVSDAFLTRVHEFTALESLSIIKSQVNSEALMAVRWPPSLRSLTLPEKMNLEVVRSLHELTQLQNLRLGVWDESASSEQIAAAIAALNAALPDSQIEASVVTPYLHAQ